MCNYCLFSLHLCLITMLPKLYGAKTNDCTLCCGTNTMTQSSWCSRTAAIMNNTHLLSGHQTWKSMGAKENQSRQFAFCLETNSFIVCLSTMRLYMTGCTLPLFSGGLNLMSCKRHKVSWAWYLKCSDYLLFSDTGWATHPSKAILNKCHTVVCLFLRERTGQDHGLNCVQYAL